MNTLRLLLIAHIDCDEEITDPRGFVEADTMVAEEPRRDVTARPRAEDVTADVISRS